MSCKGGGGEGCRHNLRFSWNGSSQAGEKVAVGTKGKISRSWQLCLYINYLQLQTLTQIVFYIFAAMADVYRNEGNEAFKKGDFINAIHFYTKGIKMNCNEKELKAKLYNNRANAHFKLGKMMITAICIFFFSFEAKGCQK